MRDTGVVVRNGTLIRALKWAIAHAKSHYPTPPYAFVCGKVYRCLGGPGACIHAVEYPQPVNYSMIEVAGTYPEPSAEP